MLELVILLAALAFPFIAMPLLWRRMKRVRDQTYRQARPLPNEPAWEETLQAQDGLQLSRRNAPSEDLIALGEKARHGRWPLDNQ